MTPIFKYQKGPGNLPDHYQRDGDSRHYQRIVAGFCPPSERPGAVIVLAEEMALRPPANIYWVDELAEYSLDRLFKAAVELKATYNIDEFFGRTSDPDFLRSLSYWNGSQTEKHLATFQLSEAPNSRSGNISLHIGILRQRLSPAKKLCGLGIVNFCRPRCKNCHSQKFTVQPI